MDVLEQLAAVWTRRFAILATALLVAATVFIWRSTAPEEYVASSTLQVRLSDYQASDPSAQVDHYAETVMGLVANREVVATALESVGRADDPADLAARIHAERAPTSGFVMVSAPGEDADSAARLADALVVAVDRHLAEDQAGDQLTEEVRLRGMLDVVLEQLPQVPSSDNAARSALIREREELISALRSNATIPVWRVQLIERAEVPKAPASPRPARDALLTLLVALIVVAQFIVVRRAWRGSISAREPAVDVEGVIGVPTAPVPAGAGAAALAPLLPHLGTLPLVVLTVGRERSARTAVLLAELLAARGESVLLLDAAPGRPSVGREIRLPAAIGFADLVGDERRFARILERLPRYRGFHVLRSGRPDAAGASRPADQLARVTVAAPQQRLVVAAALRRPDDAFELLGTSDLKCSVVVEVQGGRATRRGLAGAAEMWRGLGLELVAATVRPSTSTAVRLGRWVAHLRVSAQDRKQTTATGKS